MVYVCAKRHMYAGGGLIIMLIQLKIGGVCVFRFQSEAGFSTFYIRLLFTHTLVQVNILSTFPKRACKQLCTGANHQSSQVE